MQGLLLLIIGCVMTDDFLVRTLNLPGMLHFVPEALTGVATLCIAIVGTRDRFRRVAPKYWLVFGAFFLVILCGVINNATGVGPMLSGSRFYLRAFPLFFLAAVAPPSEREFKRALAVLLAFAIIQLPLAAAQRWIVLSEGRATGDDVQGTLMDSGILSIFLICVVLVLTGLRLRKHLSPFKYAFLSFLLLIPTTINETKGTLLFLPFGVVVTLIVGAERGKRLRYAALAVLAMAVFVAIYIPVYNSMEIENPYKNEQDITNYFSNEKQLERYMSSDVAGVGTTKNPRRGDALMVPLQFLARDPAQLAFGLGIGSVAPSNFGKNFEGAYFNLFSKFLITSVTALLLEFGICGMLVIAIMFWLIFTDTLAVARDDESIFGAFAVGWVGVISMVAAGLFYTIFHEFTSVTYLSWYFSGVMCARRMSLAYRSDPMPGRAHIPSVA
jgi:hypothetical protein